MQIWRRMRTLIVQWNQSEWFHHRATQASALGTNPFTHLSVLLLLHLSHVDLDDINPFVNGYLTEDELEMTEEYVARPYLPGRVKDMM